MEDLKNGYDPRLRPWWTAAVAQRDNSWTDLYVSNTRKQFVYSCSLPIYGATGQLLGVSVVDIHLDTLSYFLGTLRILEHGRAFVINAKDQVIGVPMQGPEDIHRLLRGGPKGVVGGDGARFELYPLQEFPDVGIRSAVSTWMKLRRPGIEESDFEVTGVDGAPYLVRMLNYPFRPDLRFTIGVIVPKRGRLGRGPSQHLAGAARDWRTPADQRGSGRPARTVDRSGRYLSWRWKWSVWVDWICRPNPAFPPRSQK